MKTLVDAASRGAAILCLLSAIIVVGCRSTWPGEPAETEIATDEAPDKDVKQPADKTDDKPSVTRPAAVASLAVLKSTDWELTLSGPGATGLPRFTWRNQQLEPLAVTAKDHREELTAALADQNPIVATNAAILLARCEEVPLEPAVTQQLIQSVRKVELNLQTRAAAAESLGTTPQNELTQQLQALLNEYGDPEPANSKKYLVPLHAALLRAMAAQSPAADAPFFVAALASPAVEVRRTALELYIAARQSDQGDRCRLPDQAVALREDLDPRVRSAALRALVAYRHPEAHEHLRQALGDYDPAVRLLAIAALGQLGGEEARESLDKLRSHPSELSRAAAVTALGLLGVDEAVVGAARDKSARVRQAVADALAAAPADAKQVRQQARATVRELLEDASIDVQQRAVAAVERWPLPEAGPLLLVALEKGGFLTRKLAAAQLAERWPAAVGFPVSGTRERRAEALAKLREAWTKEFGTLEKVAITAASRELERRTGVSPEQIAKVAELLKQLHETKIPAERRRQVVSALQALGPDLIAILENRAVQQQEQQLPIELYQEILPKLSPTFDAIERLTSNDPSVRRAATEQLVREASKGPLSPLAMQRFTQLVTLVNDPVVWQCAMALATSDPRKVSAELATMAIGHASAEVRRRACEYFAAHADPENAKVLLPVLDDPNQTVVLAAVRALGCCGNLPDRSPLVRLLTTPDKQLRTEVAASLARLGAQEGTAALERLALDTDPEVRRRAAVAMGELADPIYLPILIGLIEDRSEIQRAVLHSLVAVVGRDVTLQADGSAALPAEQARRWQQWYRQQGAEDAGAREVSAQRSDAGDSPGTK